MFFKSEDRQQQQQQQQQQKLRQNTIMLHHRSKQIQIIFLVHDHINHSFKICNRILQITK